jgi:hypothetical protein
MPRANDDWHRLVALAHDRMQAEAQRCGVRLRPRRLQQHLNLIYLISPLIGRGTRGTTPGRSRRGSFEARSWRPNLVARTRKWWSRACVHLRIPNPVLVRPGRQIKTIVIKPTAATGECVALRAGLPIMR